MKQIILTSDDSLSEALWTVWVDAIKEELIKTVEFSKTLKVTDIDDPKQLAVIKSTKNWYVKTRNSIKRAFKSKRDEYTKLSKDNLSTQNDVISVIEEEEERLTQLVDIVTIQALRSKNQVILPDRRAALDKCEADTADSLLLDMTEKEFETHLTGKRIEYADKKEEELKQREIQIARDKEIEVAKEEARIKAEKKAAQDIEDEKIRVQKEKEAALKKVEDDKLEALVKAEQEKEAALKIERDKLEAIQAEKRAVEQAELKKKEAEELEKLRIKEEERKQKEEEQKKLRDEKFIAYKNSIEFDKAFREDGKIVFYKKVWEFIS